MGGRQCLLLSWLALFLFATSQASLLRPEGPAARPHHDHGHHTMTPDKLKQLYATVEFYANISTAAKPYLLIGDMVDALPRSSKNLMSIFMLAHQLQLRIVEPFASINNPSTFHAFKTEEGDIPLSELYDPDVFGPCFPDMKMVPLEQATHDLLSRGGEAPGGGSIRVAAVSLMYLGEQRNRRRKIDDEGGGVDAVDSFAPSTERSLAQSLEDAAQRHGLKIHVAARFAVNAAASSCALRSVEEGLVGGHCGNLLFEHKLRGADAVIFVKWTGVQRELDKGRASVRFLRPGRAGQGAHAGSCCHSPGTRSMLDAQREASLARCLKFQHKYLILAEGFIRDHLRRPFLGVQVRSAELFQWHHSVTAAKAAMTVQAPVVPSHASSSHADEAVGACVRAAGGATYQLASQGGEHSILLLSDAIFPGPEALAAGAGTNLAAAQAAAGITGTSASTAVLPTPATVATWQRQYLAAASEAGRGHDVPVVPFTRMEGHPALTAAVVEMLLQVQADRFIHFSSPLTSAAGPEPWVDAIRQLSGVKRGTVGVEMVPACDMAAAAGGPPSAPHGADAGGHPHAMALRHHHHHRFPHSAGSSSALSHKVGVVGGGGNAAHTAAVRNFILREFEEVKPSPVQPKAERVSQTEMQGRRSKAITGEYVRHRYDTPPKPPPRQRPPPRERPPPRGVSPPRSPKTSARASTRAGKDEAAAPAVAAGGGSSRRKVSSPVSLDGAGPAGGAHAVQRPPRARSQGGDAKGKAAREAQGTASGPVTNILHSLHII